MLARRNCYSQLFAPSKTLHATTAPLTAVNGILTCRDYERKKKKVCFADEKVGGVLCQVKVFETSKHFDEHMLSFFGGITFKRSVFKEETLKRKNLCVLTYGTVDNANAFGLVAVKKNLMYKTVYARITLDNWSTFRDVMCRHIQRESSLDFDCFFFLTAINGDQFFKIKECIEFAVYFRTNEEQSWDNNDEKNYAFHDKRERHLIV